MNTRPMRGKYCRDVDIISLKDKHLIQVVYRFLHRFKAAYYIYIINRICEIIFFFSSLYQILVGHDSIDYWLIVSRGGNH